VPYFWSDQYDVKIQVIGHPGPDDEVVVVDGSVDERRFVALYGRAGRFTAALGFSRPRQLMGYRPLLEAGASFDEALAHLPA
jgi:3-phenylpropionate/trans-cinnamate dioxygenase ferredoxin reductase subunit